MPMHPANYNIAAPLGSDIVVPLVVGYIPSVCPLLKWASKGLHNPETPAISIAEVADE
jgi:hypothetical protein